MCWTIHYEVTDIHIKILRIGPYIISSTHSIRAWLLGFETSYDLVRSIGVSEELVRSRQEPHVSHISRVVVDRVQMRMFEPSRLQITVKLTAAHNEECHNCYIFRKNIYNYKIMEDVMCGKCSTWDRGEIWIVGFGYQTCNWRDCMVTRARIVL
jgi:hypothetical protein